jgi:hypothetical protein
MKKTITLVLLALSALSSYAWLPMGTGLTGGRVRSMVMYNNTLVAAGDFTSPNHVAQYNGTSWVILGDGLGSASSSTDKVYCLAVYQSKLYAGGVFTASGSGTACSNVAVYDPVAQRWNPVGTGFNGEVRCLYNDGTYLLAGGTFTGRVSSLNPGGTAWTQFGPANGFTGVVNDIQKLNTNYYVTGSIIANSTQYALGKIDAGGTTFTPVTIAFSGPGTGYALETTGSSLFLGGYFTYNGNYGLLSFDGTTATTIPYKLDPGDTVLTLLYTGGALYAGGTFNKCSSNGTVLNHFFKYQSPKPISAVDNGFDGDVYAIALNSVGGYFSAGGLFTKASGSSANNVAKTAGTTIGIEELDNLIAEQVLYPNPVIEQATLHFSSKEYLRNASLTILDTQGKVISTLPSTNTTGSLTLDFEINRQGFPTGIYYYFLSSENSRPASGKFIVQ